MKKNIQKILHRSGFIVLILMAGFIIESCHINLVVNNNSLGKLYKTTASFYSNNFNKKTTAYGEIFYNDSLTAASNSLPYNTQIVVMYKEKRIVVRINDKGPFYKSGKKYLIHNKRGLDLSQSSFSKLEYLDTGLTNIKYFIL